MKNRSIAELATLPDDALVTMQEYLAWRRMSYTGYYKRREKGLEPQPLKILGGTQRYTVAQMRDLGDPNQPAALTDCVKT